MAYESYLKESLQSMFGNGTSYPEVNGLIHSTIDVFEFEMSLNRVRLECMTNISLTYTNMHGYASAWKSLYIVILLTQNGK